MIQRFIELGEGYSDIYELLQIAKSNVDRITHLLALHTVKHNRNVTSIVVVLEPVSPGDFQPLYICREGIPHPEYIANKRYDMFKDLAQKVNKEIFSLDIKASSTFHDTGLYFQYLIGVLRLNRIIPPLQ